MTAAPNGGRGLRLLLILMALGIAAAAAAAAWAARELRTPYRGYSGPAATVVVAQGQSAGGILEQLHRAGLVRSIPVATAYLRFGLGDPPLLAGEYRFEGPQTIPQVLRKVTRGEVVARAVTLIEGMNLEETAAALAAAEFGSAQNFERAMRDPAPIRDLDSGAPDLEGYLFPDTYSFAKGTSEAAIVATLVRTFRARWRDVTPGPGAPPTVRDRVTLASIVEKEAQLDEERPVIAGVYANRLRIGMALYADPTVIHALKRLGRWNGNLTRPDLELDDPYNTYRFPGLPPGPICSPGAASLAAAAAPADVPYLYFVSRNDGSHVFSTTLAEHNRNVDRWQRQYWREKWAAERAAAGKSP
jgi:UPF0755 protein